MVVAVTAEIQRVGAGGVADCEGRIPQEVAQIGPDLIARTADVGVEAVGGIPQEAVGGWSVAFIDAVLVLEGDQVSGHRSHDVGPR